MNNVTLMGRLVRDPEVRQTNSGMATARFSLAVDRRVKAEQRNDPNVQTADFISCVAFGKTAEVIRDYVGKGTKLGITGHIQTGKYTNKDGQTVYTTDVVVNTMEFAESKKNDSSGKQAPAQPTSAPPMNMPVGDEEELPWS